MPSGTAMIIAMIEVTIVAQNMSRMPKRGSVPPGTHSREVRKLTLLLSSAGTAWMTQEGADQGDDADDEDAGALGEPAEDPVPEAAGRGAVTAERGAAVGPG